MSNSPNPDRVILSLRVARDLMCRLEKLAAEKNSKPAKVANDILLQATENVYLTAQDYANIAADIEEAIRLKKEGKRATQANRTRSNSKETRKTGRE